MKIFYLMGKSASGKDTIYRRLLRECPVTLSRIILYTTRPMRSSERNGREYYFIREEAAQALKAQGRVIEERVYHTIAGPWHYLTVDDGQVREEGNYLAIGTLESYLKVRRYFGEEKVVPLYLELDDGLRLFRALERERSLEQPRYEEMCRRFLADQEDFSEDKLEAAGIKKRYDNTEGDECINEIIRTIEECRD